MGLLLSALVKILITLGAGFVAVYSMGAPKYIEKKRKWLEKKNLKVEKK